MNLISINGRTITVPDGNVSVVNNKIYVNGKLIEDFEKYEEKNIKIIIEGNLNGDLTCGSSNVTIKGSTHNIRVGSGDVKISGNVSGNIETGSGDVICNKIEGSVKTGSGDVKSNNFVKNLIGNIFA